MATRKSVRYVWLVGIGLGIFATVMRGCECQKSVDSNEEDIDRPSIAKKEPSAEKPLVLFPSHLHTKDQTVNKFIEKALTICAQGDYDQFRQLFSSSFTPPKQADFERIWHGVQDVTVVSVRADNQEPPTYYSHAMVQLRQPDRKEREIRNVVIEIFKEAGEWRIAPPTKEIVRKVIALDSQPAGGAPSTKDSP